MTPTEFDLWVKLYEELGDPEDDEPNAWQTLLWEHLESLNYRPDVSYPDYSDAIQWAAFWIALGTVLGAWLMSGRPM